MKVLFSHFTPSMMKQEILEAVFVQREKIAKRTVELIEESILTSTKYYTLFVGPRGIGKTHLVSIIYHRIQRREDLKDKVFIAWLREEEWGVSSFLDLLLRIFRSLITEYKEESLQQKIETLYELTAEEAEKKAGKLLIEFVQKKTLLIFIENLDDLFQNLGEVGQQKFRSYLQENQFCSIVATSPSLFNGVSLQTSPFYGFFRFTHLERLSFEDAITLLTKIAGVKGDEGLETLIQTPVGRSRIHAVEHLSGGNHRLYIIFSQFLTSDSLKDLVAPFMRTLDELTPYYQSRMALLSPQQRKIIEFLCERRNAVLVKEIAQYCFITHQTTSSQLKILKEKGYVKATSVGRESYYELSEPLMRLCIEVKKHRSEPIRLFVEFLRLWYSREELKKRLDLIPREDQVEREYILKALIPGEKEILDPMIKALVQEYSEHIKQADFKGALPITEELVKVRGEPLDWYSQGYCLNRLKQFEKALLSFQEVLKKDSKYAQAWEAQGVTLQKMNRYDEALNSFDQLLQHNPNSLSGWFNRGKLLYETEKYKEALVCFDKLIQLDPKNALAYLSKGLILDALGQYNEALEAYEGSIQLNEKDKLIWFLHGTVLNKLSFYNKSLQSYDKAIEIDKTFELVWFHRGIVLAQLERYENALLSFKEVIQLCAQHQEKDPTEDLSLLVRTLTESIPLLLSPEVNNLTVENWGKSWDELVEKRPEFQTPRRLLDYPLRLLEAILNYRKSPNDKRPLLKLSLEERSLLSPFIKD